MSTFRTSCLSADFSRTSSIAASRRSPSTSCQKCSFFSNISKFQNSRPLLLTKTDPSKLPFNNLKGSDVSPAKLDGQLQFVLGDVNPLLILHFRKVALPVPAVLGDAPKHLHPDLGIWGRRNHAKEERLVLCPNEDVWNLDGETER